MELTEELRALLTESDRVVALTGAGVSAESGVPTFREAQTGLWERFDPSQLATPEAFARDPALVWDWYAWRRELVSRAEPNAGHLALARWQALRPQFVVVTQNVDGLHQRAGSRDVIELHGSITRIRCADGGHIAERWSDAERPPRCPLCKSLLRPDVVWFGEALPERTFARAAEAVAGAELVLSIGTSSLVQPAASLPYLAVERGVPVVEINPSPTPLSADARHSLRGTAGEVLPALLAALES